MYLAEQCKLFGCSCVHICIYDKKTKFNIFFLIQLLGCVTTNPYLLFYLIQNTLTHIEIDIIHAHSAS